MTTQTDTALPSLDARVRFPLPPGLPWNSLRSTVWRAQKISDPIAAHRIALEYEEELTYEHRVYWLAPGPAQHQLKEQARLVRRLRLMSDAYHARAKELWAAEIKVRVSGLLESSEYLQRHPEMLEGMLCGGDSQDTRVGGTAK